MTTELNTPVAGGARAFAPLPDRRSKLVRAKDAAAARISAVFSRRPVAPMPAREARAPSRLSTLFGRVRTLFTSSTTTQPRIQLPRPPGTGTGAEAISAFRAEVAAPDSPRSVAAPRVRPVFGDDEAAPVLREMPRTRPTGLFGDERAPAEPLAGLSFRDEPSAEVLEREAGIVGRQRQMVLPATQRARMDAVAARASNLEVFFDAADSIGVPQTSTQLADYNASVVAVADGLTQHLVGSKQGSMSRFIQAVRGFQSQVAARFSLLNDGNRQVPHVAQRIFEGCTVIDGARKTIKITGVNAQLRQLDLVGACMREFNANVGVDPVAFLTALNRNLKALSALGLIAKASIQENGALRGLLTSALIDKVDAGMDQATLRRVIGEYQTLCGRSGAEASQDTETLVRDINKAVGTLKRGRAINLREGKLAEIQGIKAEMARLIELQQWQDAKLREIPSLRVDRLALEEARARAELQYREAIAERDTLKTMAIPTEQSVPGMVVKARPGQMAETQKAAAAQLAREMTARTTPWLQLAERRRQAILTVSARIPALKAARDEASFKLLSFVEKHADLKDPVIEREIGATIEAHQARIVALGGQVDQIQREIEALSPREAAVVPVRPQWTARKIGTAFVLAGATAATGAGVAVYTGHFPVQSFKQFAANQMAANRSAMLTVGSTWRQLGNAEGVTMDIAPVVTAMITASSLVSSRRVAS